MLTLRRNLPSYLLLFAVLAADYLTGAEVQFGSFYLLTVAFAGWNLGPRALALYVAVTVTLWMVMGWLMGIHFSHPWVMAWNTVNRLGSTAITAVAVFVMKTTLDGQRRLIRKLGKASLDANHLRELVPFCRLCQRVHVGPDYEARLDAYLQENPAPGLVGDVCHPCLDARIGRLARVPVDAYFSSATTPTLTPVTAGTVTVSEAPR